MIKLMTCNLRCDVKDDGENYFFNRQDRLVQRLLSEAPDVIGFQEMTVRIREALTSALTGYTLLGSGRGRDLDGEANCVAIRRDTIELHALYTRWLSETPDVPGSRYADQSSCPRIVTATRLYHPKSRTLFGFYNTHLDHVSAYAQTSGFRFILSLMAKDNAALPLPRFLTGDFNFTPDSREALSLFTPDCPLKDLTRELGGTYHGFGRVPAMKIDYILANAMAARGQTQAAQIHECHNGVYLSDHDPVLITWEPAQA